MDEWTKADTGVGAAIAAGNHLENGIWALLVIAAIKIDKQIIEDIEEDQRLKIYQLALLSANPIDNSNIASPMRFVRAVIIPAPKDLGF